MIRTIEEMEQDDDLGGSTVSVGDVLLFAVVAGDYLRAKRRRFPLSDPDIESDHRNDNSTSNHRGAIVNDIIRKAIIIEDQYFPLNGVNYLFNYNKEYVE